MSPIPLLAGTFARWARARCASLILIVAASCAGYLALAAAAETPQGPRGIYLYRENPAAPSPDFERALAVPGVDGMAVVLDWSTIEPKPDEFVFDTLDAQLALARAHALSIELAIRAGKSVPAWLAGPSALKLAYAPHRGEGRCQDVTTPPPWDHAYQSAFAAMLGRTAEYLRSRGVTPAVVKLTGLNATTEELRLPAEGPDETAACPSGGTDDVAEWQRAGYTPARIEQAFDELAASFARIFADVPVAVALIPQGPFPPIDDRGRLVRGRAKQTLGDGVLSAMIGNGARRLPGRFILQHDFLLTDRPADTAVMSLAREHDLPVAWQTNLWLGRLGKGAACGGTVAQGTPCTDDEYFNLLEQGIHPAGGSGRSAQGLFIEVFAADVVAHPAVIAKAHAELTAGSARRWGLEPAAAERRP
jgi:hypothetical protein